ncbi:MAG: ketoacyl-ACP synthase III [Candidatus Eisenbacteria bacterium]|uniref:Beta-ketoacyl-[acyl-carrier-protein] synthase III n=1 Tax=Eiseniibacteriota bacterium TaxID=2212470 RepID=A0A849SM86_UNCEI|nr:ketoacyl-ACP synthase III [Candidatus Eisenbacteria bacterium]
MSTSARRSGPIVTPQREVRGAAIAGTGMYVPEQVVTNADMARIVETSDEWIVERTGIRERRKARPDQASSDLALIAARRALEMAGLEAVDIDHIVLATTSPDRYLPSCACTLQHKLGATRAAAYDVFAACTGFVFGLGIGRALIAGGAADTVLVVGVETLSRITNYQDRNTCVLFGDAAGAVVLRPCAAGDGVRAVHMQSDGELGDVLEIAGGGSREPASEDTVRDRKHFIAMRGKKLFPFAVRSMEDSLRQVVGEAGWGVDDLDLVIPHQANIRIIDAVRERLGIPAERVVVNIDRYGNTSSATIPVALDEIVRAGRLKPGDKLGICAFGGGATWGAAALSWTRARVEPESADAAGNLAAARSDT